MYNLKFSLKSLQEDRLNKIILVVNSILLFFVLVIISGTKPAVGYEISIYGVYPWYFWFIISFLLASPLTAIILKSIAGQTRISYISISIFYSLLSIIVLLSLPAFRGYLFYGAGDTHTHLKLIKDISSSGHFGITNVYPGIHIFIFSIILSCSPEKISLYVPQILFTLYIASSFLLSRALDCSHEECLSITSFSILPVIGFWLVAEYIMPSTDAFFLIPLALFCAIRAKFGNHMFPFSVLSVFLLILFPFLHVESTIFLFMGILFLSFIFKRDNAYISALILFIGCITWFSSTLAFGGSIRIVYDALVLGLVPSTPPLQALMSKGFRIEIVDAIYGIIRTYGPALVYLGIGGFISTFYLIRFIFKKYILDKNIFLSILFITYAVFNFLFLYKGTFIGFHIFRQIKYSLLVSTIIIGLFFIRLLNITNRKFIYHLFLLLFTVGISILMVYNIYPSPSSYAINYQPTDSDIAGMNFFFCHRNNTFLIIEPIDRAYQTRWSDMLNISDKSGLRWAYNDKDVKPPSHFGYNLNNNAHLGDVYNISRYLLVYPPCEIYYQVLSPNYPEFWVFSSDDFKLLNWDSTVNIVYSNYALKIMLINPRSLAQNKTNVHV